MRRQKRLKRLQKILAKNVSDLTRKDMRLLEPVNDAVCDALWRMRIEAYKDNDV